ATAASENLFNCLNGGNAEGFVALLTPNFLLAVSGSANPYDAVAGFAEIPPIGVRSVDNAQTYGEGRVSVDVVHSGFLAFGPAQVNRSRLFFVEEDGFRRLDAAEALPVEGADATIDVQMVDYAFVLSESTVPAGGLVAFDIVNTGAYPHEFAVVRLPEGVTVEQVLEDPSLEEQIAFFGANFAGPGGNASFALENLEAGTYTVVCFVDEPEGIPHVVRGMVAEFTVR
ncbi:MAG: cupredoxin domain-containing protein, partial [Chloroflexota bacterium]|nr:cupredoxin domain-containing protein [Chloroflexota bacterium]